MLWNRSIEELRKRGSLKEKREKSEAERMVKRERRDNFL